MFYLCPNQGFGDGNGSKTILTVSRSAPISLAQARVTGAPPTITFILAVQPGFFLASQ